MSKKSDNKVSLNCIKSLAKQIKNSTQTSKRNIKLAELILSHAEDIELREITK